MQGGLHRPARHGRSPDYYLSNSFNKSETNDTHTSLFSPSLQVPLWEPPPTNKQFSTIFFLFFILFHFISFLFFFFFFFFFLFWFGLVFWPGLFCFFLLMGKSNYREKHWVDRYSLVDAGGTRFVRFFFNQYTEMVIVSLRRRLSFGCTVDIVLRYQHMILMNQPITHNCQLNSSLIEDSFRFSSSIEDVMTFFN